MSHKHLSIDIKLKAYFYDVDPMGIVWHGNYAKFLEQARCALLDVIGYNYAQMEESGYGWPIVTMQSKFIRPIAYNQEFIVQATLLEYENRIKIGYTISDPITGGKIHKAETVQMAIDMKTLESLLVSPSCLIQAVENAMRKKENKS